MYEACSKLVLYSFIGVTAIVTAPVFAIIVIKALVDALQEEDVPSPKEEISQEMLSWYLS